jgi:hypothetical protein
MGWAGNVYHGADHWLKTEQEWDANAKALTTPPLMIKFEDLISDPPKVLESICHYFGVPFETSMLEFDKGTTYDKPDVSLTVQWRKKLSPREVQLVEARVGPMLARAGYERSGLTSLSLNPAQRFALRTQSRVGTFRFAIGRYGLPLATLFRIVSRTGPDGLRRRIRRRIDEIDVLHLK